MDTQIKNGRLEEYKKNITSQHGEDGIIAEIFRRMGAENKWCVEFGALNGTHHSNTWKLIMQDGWSGVLIEADPTYAEKLKEVYKNTPRARCFNEFVEFEGEHSLDSILARTSIPRDFDLLSVDIDDASIDKMNSDTSCYTRLFQLYDGTLVLDGYKKLFWHNLPIKQEDIQVLTAHRRTYPSGVSSKWIVRTIKYYVRKLSSKV